MKNGTRKIKRYLCAGLAAVVTLLSGGIFSSCASGAPDKEEIYDRTVWLIENAAALDVVFAGNGLPVCDRNLPTYRELYANTRIGQYTKDYDVVSEKAEFRSVEEIKAAAEKVFSPALLEQILYVNAFEGQVLTDAPGGSLALPAQYLEDGTYLYQYAEAEKTASSPLVFNYATMKIEKPSTKTAVQLSLDAWEADRPEEIFSYRLRLVRGEDGEWLLDKLTV